MSIFVFGSNLAGVHGSGAAKDAHDKYGAVYGLGSGYQPGRKSYAIPTKDEHIQTLPLAIIKMYVNQFIDEASGSTDDFAVTAIGCGLAGYSAKHIAPMFVRVPTNCCMPRAWADWLPDHTNFWVS